jgi:hypothetical protein
MLEGYQITELLTTLIISASVVLLAYSPLPRHIGQAIGQRLVHGKTAAPGSVPTDPRLDDVLEDNAMLRRQLEEVQDRVEFAERMLAQARERGQLGAGKESA